MDKHTCPRCGETNLNQFYRDRRKGIDGRQTYCKACAKAHRKAWDAQNPDKVREYHKKTRLNRKKRKTKPPIMAKNIYDQVASNNLRAKRRNQSASKIKSRDWEKLLLSYLDGCPGCQKPWALAGAPTLDHIQPLDAGGKNTIKNAQPLCRSCNSRKNKRWNYLLKKYDQDRESAWLRLREREL